MARIPSRLAALALSFAVAGLGAKAPAAESQTAAGVSIGDFTGPKATLVAIDDYSLPFRKDLCYYLSAPTVRAEPVLRPSRGNPHAADTMGAYCYASVLHEGGKYRMWYYGSYRETDRNRTAFSRSVVHEGPVCYAESIDGLHWVKPKLGQVDFNGGNDNNIIALPATDIDGPYVIRDDGDPDGSRRYKMVYENTSFKEGPRARRIRVDMAISADGLVWKANGTAAWLLEPSAFYQFKGLYWMSAQDLAYIGEGGHRSGREGFVWVSPDFDHWLAENGETFLLPEPADGNLRGHDQPYVQVHEGVGSISYGNVLVGLYCQWHAHPNPGGDWLGLGTTYGDLGLVVSNDGQHFREVVKGYVYLDRHHSWAAMSPEIRTEEILDQTGNAMLNDGDKTLIYHGRWMNAEKFEDWYSEIALATLPRDRWGALGLYPHSTEGSVWSAPLTLGRAGCAVSLNAQGVQGMRVEIADENFRFLPEYSGEAAGVAASGDGLDCAVAWPKASLDPLTGRKIRLHLVLKKAAAAEARLFAVYVSAP